MSFLIIFLLFTCFTTVYSFRAVAIGETDGLHGPFVAQAKIWLANLTKYYNFTVDHFADPFQVSDQFLSKYQLFIELNYPPYNWGGSAQQQAFTKYIDQGLGGWVGLHHASLLGEFDGFPLWQWFSDFMGNILWKDYIATFSTATVDVEDATHPILKNVPSKFTIENEEWYTWNKSPRLDSDVHVLAHVDESTYNPDSTVKMGDHPVVWTNTQKKAKNVYIFMGHHPELFQNTAFTTLFQNAIFWAGNANSTENNKVY